MSPHTSAVSTRTSKGRIAASAVLAVLACVLGSSVEAAAAPARVFIETDVSSRSPYVQAATRVIVRVYSARALYHPDLDLPASADVLVRQIGNDDHSTVERGGRSYDVLTRQYLVFPQRSGKLMLPAAQLSAQVLTSNGRPDPYRGTPGQGAISPYGYGALSIAVEPLQLKGDAIPLDVRARPASAVGSYWMPARQVTLTSAWQPPSLQAHVGDALTLDVTEQADGLTAEQLPDVTTLIDVPAGLKVYPEEPKLDNFSEGDTVIGRRQQSIALIADRPGAYTMPALHLKWWDTTHDAPQEIVLPPRTLAIGAAAAAPAVSTARGLAAADNVLGASAARDPWRWATIALGVAWLLTLAGWYAARRRSTIPPQNAADEPVSSPGASRARAAFLDACSRHDARAARRHLIAWSAAEWKRTPPAGLNGLARRIGDEEIARLLRELDRACFAGGAWRGDALALAFDRWPAHRAGAASLAPAKARKTPLAPLYH
ncbi:MAG TPA: hypothetical protein VGI35_05405 [Steroidobacteraceae bacterium]